MKFRLLRFVSLLLLSIVLITACNSTTTVTYLPPPPLRVGYSLWAGHFPIAIAQEKGFFQAQGVKVEPVYSENFLVPLSNFSANKNDGVALPLGSVMSKLGQNPDAKIVLVTDQSAGADALLVQRDIKSVADLKGKRIGTKLGDFGELFVTKILETKGLSTQDVSLVNIEAEAIPAFLKSSEIQAGQTWEPYVSQAVKSGAKVLFTSKDTPGLIPDVIVFHSTVVRDRPQDVKAFIRAWFQAQDYWKANPEESKIIIAKTLNIKPETISTDGIKLSSLQDNLKAFTPGSTTQSLYHTAKLYADFYTRTGGLSAAPDIQKLIDSSFVQQLQKVN